MWWAIDLLAGEYSWNKSYILESVYMDDLFELVKRINKRHTSDYKMQLAIVQNPHTKNPKELWEAIDRQTQEEQKPAKLDRAGMDRLKSALGQNPRFIVK